MSSYHHFTTLERECLQLLLSLGFSFRAIAAILEKSPSSISREVRRNRSKQPRSGKSDNPFNYHFWRARTLAVTRRRDDRCTALKPDTKEWNYIISGLTKFWSPEEIVYRWRLENPEGKHFGVSTIYRYIKANRFPNISRKTHLRRRNKKSTSRTINFNSVKPDRTIRERPERNSNRLGIGDWEGDTVQGKPGHGTIVTQVDRKSRYLVARICRTKQAEEIKEAVIEMLNGFPVESISLDNGSEFAKFREIEEALDTLIYFAEPHKPWQRGTNENTNGILRFFFPKGCDLLTVTQEELDYVVSLINNRPRKCLGWKTPAEVFFSNTVALA